MLKPSITSLRRVALLAGVVAALAAAPALADAAPARQVANANTCIGSVKTTDATGAVVNQNQYAAGSDVYLQGSGFPANQKLTYTIDQTNGPASGPSGSFSADAKGDFLVLVWHGASGPGEFKVEASYTPSGGKGCEKSDNFKVAGAVTPPTTNPPATNPPATNPPITNPTTNPPATNPPATNPPATNPPATNPPATNPPATNPSTGNPTTSPSTGTTAGTPADAFSCRASAARVRTSSPLPALLIEPVVANDPDVPCANDSHSLVSQTTIGPLTAGLLSADTAVTTTTASASTRVAGVGLDLGSPSTVALPLLPPLTLPGLLPLSLKLTALESSATYNCQNGLPAPSGSSQVAGLVLDVLGIQVPLNIPDPSQPVDLDLGGLLTVHLNQQVVTPTSLTQRALSITSALLGIEVTLGESVVDFAGNPCGSATPPTTVPPSSPPTVITVKVPTKPASAKLVGAPKPGSTSTTPFTARVVGKQIAKVVFTLDGKPLSGSTPTSVRIAPRSLDPGLHTLRAKVTFSTASKTKPKTLSTRFRTKAAQVLGAEHNPAINPRFTG